jgi:glycosyltransferase involved in cell wall biosynthesis
LVALNVLKKKWQIKFFKILVNWIYSKCDVILAQSKSILKELNNNSSIKNKTYYFPSWGESDLFFKSKIPAPEVSNRKIFTILFAGNIGEAQDFPNIIKAVQHLSQQNINNFRMLIVGGGSKKEWVLKEVKKLNIEKYFEFHGNYPLERMSSFLLHADALLVSLSNNKVFNMTIPGKVQFYLSSGIPIIGMICGEAAKVIKESKAGYVCDSGDYKSLSKIIYKISKTDKSLLNEMGRNGRKYAEKEFSKTSLINKLNKILIETAKKNL